MASGSYFLILEKTDIVLKPEELKALNINYIMENLFVSMNSSEITDESLPLHLEKLQNYLELRNVDSKNKDDFCINHYYNKSTGNVYKIIAQADFISDFYCLKDYFGMNPYNSTGDVEIHSFELYKMIEALEYINNPDLWNRYIENTILKKNEFISVFEYLDLAFEKRFMNFDGIDEEENLSKYQVKRMLEIFNSFIFLIENSEKELKLVYKTW